MFGLFSSATFDDPQFGRFTHSKGMWRGEYAMPNGSRVPLLLAGDKRAPLPAALDAARLFASEYARWQPVIADALREHAEPYMEEANLDLRADAAVWEQVGVQYVAVEPQAGGLTTEIGLAADWDEEHWLGARFRHGTFVELNGSVMMP